MASPFFFTWRGIAATAAATLALSAGADTGSPASPPAKPQAGSGKAPGPWVVAKSKHTGSGVRLRYSVPAQMQPGQPARVQLQFSGVTSEGATADLRAPEGATLATDSGQPPGRIALTVGQVTTVALRIVPAADGMQTLDVFTSQAERSSVQSVPLKVGSGEVKLKAMGKAETTLSGEKVISLPAQTPAK